jgi:hypothetical protein
LGRQEGQYRNTPPRILRRVLTNTGGEIMEAFIILWFIAILVVGYKGVYKK